MTSATYAQFPKYVANALVSTKMKPIPPLEMGNETYQCTKGAFGHLNELGLKSLLKTFMRVKLKDVS
jgi:hypothetical protein